MKLVSAWLAIPFWQRVAAGFVLGFVSQAVKICVDSTLQEVVHDDFRGRVFSVTPAPYGGAAQLPGWRNRHPATPHGGRPGAHWSR